MSANFTPNKEDIKILPPFKMQVLTNFPYIEADFDALTNYQLLCKIVEYLNMVIHNENEVTEEVTGLYNAYIALQNYVNNYFDNLDVQDEINNKLDEMAESGELEQMIETYLNSKALFCYDTVEDMKEATNLINGSYARTLGNSTINDGGGAIYKIVDQVDSSHYQITLDSGLYATYINESLVVSIDNFGGATAEEKLYNALNSITYGTIIAGNVEINHVYNATAKDYRNITILGATLDLKIDYWFNQASASYKTSPLFKSCSIKGNGHIFYDNTYQIVGSTFDNCDLNNVTLYSSSNSDNFVQSLYIIGSTLNSVGNLITAGKVYDMKITNTRVEAGSEKLIVLTNNESILQGSISNCLIEGRTAVILEFVSAYKLVIENCYFESNTQGLINQIGANKATYVTIRDNVFFGDLTADNIVTFESQSSVNQARIWNNLSNVASGKLLCNKNLNAYWKEFLSQTNYNYSHPWKNNGFAKYTNGIYNSLSAESLTPTWTATDNSWTYVYNMPYTSFYSWAHPLYVIFSGCFGTGSANYQGYAIIRLTPRVAYSAEDGVHNVCDLTIVDSCNKNNVVKTSDVTATVELSNTSSGATTLTFTIKIFGFNSTRGNIRVIDPYTIFQTIALS